MLVLEQEKVTHLIATWLGIQVLESINKALAPLADLTDISGKDYVAVSTIKPLHHHISTKAENDNTELTKDIKERIRSCQTENILTMK